MSKLGLFITAFAGLLVGCGSSTPNGVAMPLPSSQRSQGGVSSMKADHEAASPLQNVLSAFASSPDVPWSAFDKIAGVNWRDPAPLENPDALDAKTTRYRSGTILLAGFGLTDLPDGNVGADAGVRRGNEGESGITFNGDRAAVDSIGIVKFYPSENYQEILHRQFVSGAKVTPMANRCALDYGTSAENTQKNAFFRIELGSNSPVYVEAFIDTADGAAGPGTTTFVFYRNKPAERIAGMRCQEI